MREKLERNKRIYQLYLKGHKVAYISEKLGITKGRIYQVIHRFQDKPLDNATKKIYNKYRDKRIEKLNRQPL
jgi:transposase